MIAATINEQKKAKMKFFAAYIFSVILIIIVFASVWRNTSAASADMRDTPSLFREPGVVQQDVMLHTKLQELDNLYLAAFNGDTKEIDLALGKITPVENSFHLTLDSLEKLVPLVKDQQQKNETELVVSSFRKAFLSRTVIRESYVELLNDTARTARKTVMVPASAATNEIDNLKTMLVEKEEKLAALEKQLQAGLAEKDRVITSLQTQSSQKPVTTTPTNSSSVDGEWRAKHAKLKAGYDDLVIQNNTLSKSYKAIVDDNRRLLSQLQAARKQ